MYWTATSTDGGRTFAAPEPFLPGEDISSIGPPVLDGAAHVYVPVILGESVLGESVAVAVSPGGVATDSFTLQTVDDRATPSDFFPVAAVDRGGHVTVAWRGSEGNTRVVRFSESFNRGRSWTKVATWSGAPVATSPWVLIRNGRVDVLWYQVTAAGKESRLELTRRRAGTSALQTAVVAPTIAADSSTSGESNTDYANFDLLPDGRAVVVWGDTSVHVAVESPR